MPAGVGLLAEIDPKGVGSVKKNENGIEVPPVEDGPFECGPFKGRPDLWNFTKRGDPGLAEEGPGLLRFGQGPAHILRCPFRRQLKGRLPAHGRMDPPSQEVPDGVELKDSQAMGSE